MTDYTDEDRRAWLEENYGLMPNDNGTLCPQTAEAIDGMMREDERGE